MKADEINGSGGEGGIRTPGTREGTPHFECGTFNHSATSPRGRSMCHGRADGFSNRSRAASQAVGERNAASSALCGQGQAGSGAGLGVDPLETEQFRGASSRRGGQTAGRLDQTGAFDASPEILFVER